MTEERLAQILIDGVPIQERVSSAPGLSMGSSLGISGNRGMGSGRDSGSHLKLDKKISVFLNRLLLRLYDYPSIMSYLTDVQPVKDEESEDGAVKIQLEFLRLPQEIMPQLKRLLAAPGEVQWYEYVRNGQARMGAEIPVDPKDLEGDQYDYAY